MAESEPYIAFLRAVNVGGRKAPMATVRALFAGLGLADVRSYIASGNVFFRPPGVADGAVDRPALTSAIEARLAEGLGFEVPVMVRTASELEAALALAAAPFDRIEVTPEIRLSLAFSSEPLTGLQFPLRSPKGDWEVLGATLGELFVVLHLPDGRMQGNPMAAIEKTLGTKLTARFFHTSAKILAAARAA
jgi:uncharacterized protein (DUF1697 family)